MILFPLKLKPTDDDVTGRVVSVVADQVGDGVKLVLVSQVELFGQILSLLNVVMFDNAAALPADTHTQVGGTGSDAA